MVSHLSTSVLPLWWMPCFKLRMQTVFHQCVFFYGFQVLLYQQNTFSPVFADLMSHLEHVDGFCVPGSLTLANDCCMQSTLTFSPQCGFSHEVEILLFMQNSCGMWARKMIFLQCELSCNLSPSVCANLFSHSLHEKCFQLNDLVFALFTRVWFLSCMCFSVLSQHWICCCSVHKGMVTRLLYVLFTALNYLNSL